MKWNDKRLHLIFRKLRMEKGYLEKTYMSKAEWSIQQLSLITISFGSEFS